MSDMRVMIFRATVILLLSLIAFVTIDPQRLTDFDRAAFRIVAVALSFVGVTVVMWGKW